MSDGSLLGPSGDETIGAGPTIASGGSRPRDSAPADLAGTIVGRYSVLAKLGAGGMGVVYTAYDPKLDRRVALKVLHEGPAPEEASEGHVRLLREAQALAQLQHPNVVTIHDVGEHEGRVFLAMEYIDGMTLGRWRRDAEPDWQETLAVFTRAGDGLAAAHDNGLVHRDFKPDNVLVTRTPEGRVERVLVLDFGLARSSKSEAYKSDWAEPEIDSFSSEITQAGHVMGTPAYMAPEQHLGEQVGASSDQFSFCVALYEALYGQRAYQWETGLELVAAVVHGTAQPPPRGTAVPRRLWPVLRRGLATDPEDRFESMSALLAALRADPTLRRRQWTRAVGITAVVGGVFGAMMIADARRERDCRELASTDTLWTDAHGEEMASAFAATKLAYAEYTSHDIRSRLDAYARQWSAATERVCLATQRPDHDKASACLSEARAHFKALSARLVDADRATVRAAVSAVLSLPRLEACEDAAHLRARGAVAESEATVRMQARIADARATLGTGKYAEAVTLSRTLVADADETSDPRVAVEARVVLGESLRGAAQFQESREVLRDAVRVAGVAGLDARAGDAATKVAFVVGYAEGRHDEGLVWADLAKMWLDAASVGGVDERRARLLEVRGAVHYRRGDYDAALADYDQTVEIRIALSGGKHPGTARVINRIGAVFMERGEWKRAIEKFREALTAREQAFGTEHPLVAASLNNLAGALWQVGERTQAKAYLERSIAIREAALGRDDVSLATPLSNLSRWQGEVGDWEKAAETAERAWQLAEANYGAEHPNTALTLAELGRAQLNLDPERGLATLRDVLDRQLAALGERHTEVAATRRSIAFALAATHQYVAAATQLVKAIDAEDVNAKPSRFVALLYNELLGVRAMQGDVGSADREGERVLARCGEEACGSLRPLLRDKLAWIHLHVGDLPGAQRHSAKARAIEGDLDYATDTRLRLTRAAIRLRAGEVESAYRDLEGLRPVCERPTAWRRCQSVLRWLAEAQLLRGEHRAAVEALQRADAFPPDVATFPNIDPPFIKFALARAMA
ncbi:MAG: serine/threonine-protein kinase, partial [Myxococcota bacterium]